MKLDVQRRPRSFRWPFLRSAFCKMLEMLGDRRDSLARPSASEWDSRDARNTTEFCRDYTDAKKSHRRSRSISNVLATKKNFPRKISETLGLPLETRLVILNQIFEPHSTWIAVFQRQVRSRKQENLRMRFQKLETADEVIGNPNGIPTLGRNWLLKVDAVSMKRDFPNGRLYFWWKNENQQPGTKKNFPNQPKDGVARVIEANRRTISNRIAVVWRCKRIDLWGHSLCKLSRRKEMILSQPLTSL